MKKFCTKVTDLNRKGLGIVLDYSGKIILEIPYTLPGDSVDYELGADNKLNIVRLNKESSHRVEALCPKFGECGACSLQHASKSFLLEWKQSVVKHDLRKRGIDTIFRPTITVPQLSRRRAKFVGRRVKRKAIVGFHKRSSSEIVSFEGCVILDPSIINFLGGMEKITLLTCTRTSRVSFHVSTSESGLDVHVKGIRKFGEEIKAELIEIARDNKVSRFICDNDLLVLFNKPFQRASNFRIYPPSLFFMQATKIAENTMTESVVEAFKSEKNVADLFSGYGVFSLALSVDKRVAAYDNSGEMLMALDKAYKNHTNLKRIKTHVRDLHKSPLTSRELSQYDGIIANPPRAGALKQVMEIVKSDIRRIVYISCNVDTFSRDSKILVDGGFNLDWLRIIDQFRWSHHIEILSQFSRTN